MHPGTKRKLIYAVIATIAILCVGVVLYYIVVVLGCLPPCEWVAGFLPHCECPFPMPASSGCLSSGTLGLLEGTQTFPWEATLIGVLVVGVFVLTIRGRKL